ncbi:isochorismate synthase [Prochlorococcus sp. MIT 1307]|uniref:isochorismate synthase n=1 Tax=Prochlorococcus sp. MIT 1307 TaxID=3096219 RepID=UPI002A75D5D4|nr:isochorismate synthase [Prochlorococcus sp. MIT 1307]
MTAGPTFSDILTATAKGWCARKADEPVLSLAVRIKGVDPLCQLPLIAEKEQFRFLWDGSPGRCFAASGRCQSLDISGPRRFELAQRFSDVTLGRLIEITPEAPPYSNPRILLAFSFFEQTSECQRTHGLPPAVQAVLPRWQLCQQGSQSWLRLTAVATHEAEARVLAEKLWLMSQSVTQISEQKERILTNIGSVLSFPQQWQDCYRPALIRGIDLVNHGILDKLVLAVRQSIWLETPLDPLGMLSRLRRQQTGSCRFLWQRTPDEVFFGASPERLLSLRKGNLQIDALAGTATRQDDERSLLRSDKDLREHELVVASIANQLISEGLVPRRPRRPQLARHGHLVHLHTPINAVAGDKSPLSLVGALHPTPAVAGFPRREAMTWLRTLEPFERGSYAAPIGWIDNSGNAEFRVAIRCGMARGRTLELTAGAGLVRGSIAQRELQEVGLKLAVLADQLDIRSKRSSSRSIT